MKYSDLPELLFNFNFCCWNLNQTLGKKKKQAEREECGVCTDYAPMPKGALCMAIHLTLHLLDSHFPHFFLNLVVFPPNLLLCNTTQHQGISQLLCHLAHPLNSTYSTQLGSFAMSYGEEPRAVNCCFMKQQIAVHQLYNDHGKQQLL